MENFLLLIAHVILIILGIGLTVMSISLIVLGIDMGFDALKDFIDDKIKERNNNFKKK